MRVSKEFIKYCLVGIINTIAGLTTAYIFLNILSCSYFSSTAAAYIIGISVSFVLNKNFTFKDKNSNQLSLFMKFTLTMLPSYIISYFLGWMSAKTIFSIDIFNTLFGKITQLINISQNKISDNIAVLISMTIYLLLGFLVNKFLIFTKKNEPQI